MGNFHISIRGIGTHHNRNVPQDVNRMAARFAQELKDAGHSVSSAAITTGGEDDVGRPGYLSEQQKLDEEESAKNLGVVK